MGSEGSCTRCEIRGSEGIGVALQGGSAVISDSEIFDSSAVPNIGGYGVVAIPYTEGSLTFENELFLSESTVSGHATAGVWLEGPGSYLLQGNTLEGGQQWAFNQALQVHGDALFAGYGVEAWDGEVGLLLQDNDIQDADGAGVFLHAASGALDGNRFSGNALDVVQQACDADLISPLGLTGTEQVVLCSEDGDVAVLHMAIEVLGDLGGISSE
jgi:hypothetical protein